MMPAQLPAEPAALWAAIDADPDLSAYLVRAAHARGLEDPVWIAPAALQACADAFRTGGTAAPFPAAPAPAVDPRAAHRSRRNTPALSWARHVNAALQGAGLIEARPGEAAEAYASGLTVAEAVPHIVAGRG